MLIQSLSVNVELILTGKPTEDRKEAKYGYIPLDYIHERGMERLSENNPRQKETRRLIITG